MSATKTAHDTKFALDSIRAEFGVTDLDIIQSLLSARGIEFRKVVDKAGLVVLVLETGTPGVEDEQGVGATLEPSLVDFHFTEKGQLWCLEVIA